MSLANRYLHRNIAAWLTYIDGEICRMLNAAVYRTLRAESRRAVRVFSEALNPTACSKSIMQIYPCCWSFSHRAGLHDQNGRSRKRVFVCRRPLKDFCVPPPWSDHYRRFRVNGFDSSCWRQAKRFPVISFGHGNFAPVGTSTPYKKHCTSRSDNEH